MRQWKWKDRDIFHGTPAWSRFFRRKHPPTGWELITGFTKENKDRHSHAFKSRTPLGQEPLSLWVNWGAWKNPVFPLGPCSDSQRTEQTISIPGPAASSITKPSWLGLSTGLSLVSSKTACRADRESQSDMTYTNHYISEGEKKITSTSQAHRLS